MRRKAGHSRRLHRARLRLRQRLHTRSARRCGQSWKRGQVRMRYMHCVSVWRRCVCLWTPARRMGRAIMVRLLPCNFIHCPVWGCEDKRSCN